MADLAEIAKVKLRLGELVRRKHKAVAEATPESATTVGQCDRTIDVLLARLSALLPPED